jgi:hypothetical protein
VKRSAAILTALLGILAPAAHADAGALFAVLAAESATTAWTPVYALMSMPTTGSAGTGDYVDTGIVLDSDTDLRMLVYIRTTANPYTYQYCGANPTSGGIMIIGAEVNGTTFGGYYGGQSSGDIGNASNNTWYWLRVEPDGVEINSTRHNFVGAPSATGANRIFIGAVSRLNVAQASVSTPWNYARVQIIKGGVLVQDLQAQAGGYFRDAVSGTNIYAKSGGTFAVTNIVGSTLPTQSWK